MVELVAVVMGVIDLIAVQFIKLVVACVGELVFSMVTLRHAS